MEAKSAYAEALRQQLKTYEVVLFDFTHLQKCLDVKAKYRAYNVHYPGLKLNGTTIFDYESFLWAYLSDTDERPFPSLTSLTVRELHCGLGQRKGSEEIHLLTQFKDLVELNIRGCCPPVNSIQFWNMSKLKELRLDFTGITSLSPSIGALKNLELLSLDSNGLFELPITLAFCQKIRTISLKDNSFTSLPVVLLKMKDIENLNVAGNHLIKLVEMPTSVNSTDEVQQPASLMCTASMLNDLLDHWKLENFDPMQQVSLAYPASCQTACLWCNTIISHEGHSIQVFMVSFKLLSDAPFKLPTCSAICNQELASYCTESYAAVLFSKIYERHALSFSTDSAEIMNFENISELNLSEIHIPHYIQSLMQIWKMSNVKKLCLDRTGILCLSPLVGKMKKLEALSLEHNFLSALPITLEFCQNLTALNLMNNNFTSVPDIVLRLRDLTELRHSCKDPADLWDISVKAMPLEQPACIEKNVGLLQSLCMAAVFEKHVDYLRQEAGCPTQIQAALDYLASRIIICHMCSKVVSHEHIVKATLFYIGQRNIPFVLPACSLRCQQDLVIRCREVNVAGLYLNALKSSMAPSENGFHLPIVYTTDNPQRSMYRLMQFETCVELDFSSIRIQNDLLNQFEFWNMPNLTKLCMDHIGLSILMSSVGELINLEKLSVESNNLFDLPSTLECCQKLSSLCLSENKFTHIPGVVLKLKNLKELRITDNPLVGSEITVTNNPIELKPTSLNSKLCHQKMTSHYSEQYLVGLYFKAFERCGIPCAREFNPILPCSMGMVTSVEMKKCLVQCESIVELDFSHIHIPIDMQFRFQFWEMCNLKRLSLNATGILRVHPSIGKMKNLEVLSLNYNRLSDLPITLRYCQKLTTLGLAGNKFSALPGLILKLMNLKVLMADCNPFKARNHPTAFDAIPRASIVRTASLLDMCFAAVFMNHIEYWKQDNFTPPLWNTLQHLASTSFFCHICGLPIRDSGDYYTEQVSDRLNIECDGAPFELYACSTKCRKKLISHLNIAEEAANEAADFSDRRKKGCHIM